MTEAFPEPTENTPEAVPAQLETQRSHHTFSGRIFGPGTAELVVFDEDGKEYYDC